MNPRTKNNSEIQNVNPTSGPNDQGSLEEAKSLEERRIQMTTTPVNRLVVKLAIPSMISMLVSKPLQPGRRLFRGADIHPGHRCRRRCFTADGHHASLRIFLRTRIW